VVCQVTSTTSPGGITVKKVVARGSKKLIATIDVADNATVADFDIAVTLSDGRKGKGTTLFKVQVKVANVNDPCLDPTLDFPAFIYKNATSAGTQIFVADADGKCSRLVTVVSSGSPMWATFSYPVANTTNVGRIAWAGSGTENDGRSIDWIDFTVNEADHTIQSGQIGSMPTSHMPGGVVELSKDGRRVYFGSMALSTDSQPIVSVAMVGDSSTEHGVYTGAATGQSVPWLKVNSDETILVIEERLGSTDLFRVVLVDLPCVEGMGCQRVVADSPPRARLWPAIDSAGTTTVYSAYQDGSGGCQLLTYLDATGSQIHAGTQPRYGQRLTWLGEHVLADGMTAPNRRNKCASTDSITKIDPSTGSEVTLLRGYHPDAR